MSFGKFIIIPIGLAIQAMILMLIGPYVPGSSAIVGGPGLLIFVTFQAWAVYFAAGCTPKNGLKVFLAYAVGIAASIGVVEISKILGGMGLTGQWPVALAVFIIVIPVICCEKVDMLSFIPGIFVGSGMFFAILTLGGERVIEDGQIVVNGLANGAGYGKIALAELIGCGVGQVFGFITVCWRSAYEKKVTPAAPAEG
ncbi:MAG: DUF1097 domain-containing protein [Kiritimatiellia bacterium]|jgi:hypothetical protein|nr:DUF1097 domain-containing protein [Kiritimatiellia bacterium]MDP6848765.1 DUF1097 domain-containing protein [Kiritimatiellia bacterium]